MPTTLAQKSLVDPSLSSLYALADDDLIGDEQHNNTQAQDSKLHALSKPSLIQSPGRIEAPVAQVDLVFHPLTFPFITGCVTDVTTSIIRQNNDTTRGNCIKPIPAPEKTFNSKLKRPPQPPLHQNTRWKNETRVPTQHWMSNEAIRPNRRFFCLPPVIQEHISSLRSVKQ